MKFIVLVALLVTIQISLIVHLQSLIGYVWKKSMAYFKGFMITAVTNSLFGIILAIFVLLDRDLVRGLNMDKILVLETGVLFVWMLFIKIRITARIIRRIRDPKNFHRSYFGKKVYDTAVVDKKELMVYFITFPFTILAGAFFIVKMLKL